jgi:feruloyl esterase
MKTNQARNGRRPQHFVSFFTGCLAAAALAAPGAVLATTTTSNCSVSTLSSYGVPGVTIVEAVVVAAPTPTLPANAEICEVVGTLITSGEGAPSGSAGFVLQLPAVWNEKFLFWGVGGLAGATYADFSANPVDYEEALGKGYATAITDGGHLAGDTDGSWALVSNGVPDSAEVADYYRRATHEVTVATKNLVRAYYGAPTITHSYFDGCSNGGRQALMEAMQFPDDYDGIIAGAPFMDLRSIIAGAKFQKVQLQSAATYIPASMLPMIDAAVYASCDAADGVQDGLIQNPARCSFDPATLACRNGATSNCLTPGQVKTLEAYISALRDEHGKLIYTGASITDLTGGMDVWSTGTVAPTSFTAAEPWGGTGFAPAPVAWQFVDNILKYFVTRDASFNLRDFPVSLAGVVTDPVLAFYDSRTQAGDADALYGLQSFIQRNGKLIMFQGFSDPALPPFRTVHFYEQLAAQRGGYEQLQENVRLFMVPGMQHCIGGPGPNYFDTLTALENWNEAGTPPDGILAAHYVNNTPADGVDRTMPLCKFPEEAQYSGSGAYADGANWSCTNNQKLLELGKNGVGAGL